MRIRSSIVFQEVRNSKIQLKCMFFLPSLGLILICRWNIEQGICDWFRFLTRDMKNSLFTKFLPRKEKSVRSLTSGLAAVCFTASGRWQILFVRWQWCRGRIIATGALKVWWEKWLWEKPLVPPFTDPSISLSLSIHTCSSSFPISFFASSEKQWKVTLRPFHSWGVCLSPSMIGPCDNKLHMIPTVIQKVWSGTSPRATQLIKAVCDKHNGWF